MKDKKKLSLVIAFAVLVLGGLVYYWFFYTPTLGDYVYVERPNQYSVVVHSKESCGTIKKGILRAKTSNIITNLKEANPQWLYCNDGMSYEMINNYK